MQRQEDKASSDSEKSALRDFWGGVRSVNIWWSLAYFAMKARFRRTVIGPMWMTLSLLIWVVMLSFVNSHLFALPVRDTIPNLVVAMVFWSYIAAVINEGSFALIASAAYLKNLPVSPMAYIMQCIASNVITLGFNAVLIPFAMFMVRSQPGGQPWLPVLAVPGFLLLTLTLAFITVSLAILSLRYRDVPKIISNLVQVAFFVTPVFWLPPTLNVPHFVTFNPLYHMLELVRAPLLFKVPDPTSWLVMIALTLLCGLIALVLYTKSFRALRKWT